MNEKQIAREWVGINISVPSLEPLPKVFPAHNLIGRSILAVLLRKELKHGGVLHAEDGFLNFELNSCNGVFAVTDWKKAIRIIKCALIDVGLLIFADLAYASREDPHWKDIHITTPGFSFQKAFTQEGRIEAESQSLQRLNDRMQKLTDKLIARGKRLKPTEEENGI